MTDNRSGRGDENSSLSAEKKLKLYRAAQNGEWETARRIYHEDFGEYFGVEISRNEDTALHIAAAANRIDFVNQLLKKMSERDLEKKNRTGKTAFFLAATSGTVQIAKEMMKKNKRIAMVADHCGILPIQMAAALGHKDMVKYLYQETEDCLKEEDRKELFVSSIQMELYDVALQMFREYPDLATARAQNEETALHALARKDLGAKYVEKEKLQARELVELIWKKVILLSHIEISEIIAKPRKLLFEAAERGNSMILSILIGEYPDLIWKLDNEENKYTIFHYAVKHRQKDVFELIREIGSSTEILFACNDKDDNNILHLAAMPAPSDRLNVVPGAALQMQEELLWFKKIKRIAPPSFAEARNREGLTPKELFTREHEALRDKGEKWMKETAGSCMVVATLITGVAFAAAITIPGGNNQDTGFPVFYEKIFFRIFAISDAISLVSSSTSILNFLSFFIARFAEEDFLWLLLSKLRIGLLALFISIVAMMAMFSATFFIFFNDRTLWIAILVTVIASVPLMALYQQYTQLFSDVYSTYVSDPLFHEAKTRLYKKIRASKSSTSKSEIRNAHERSANV